MENRRLKAGMRSGGVVHPGELGTDVWRMHPEDVKQVTYCGIILMAHTFKLKCECRHPCVGDY